MKWRYSKYFAPKELLSPDGLELFARGIFPLCENKMEQFIAVRQYFGTEFFVNHGWLTKRGWRSPEENRKIYEAKGDPNPNKYSFHFWCAFDVTQDKMSAREFFEELKKHRRLFGIGGLGLYEASNFVHIDFADTGFRQWQKN